MCGLDASGMVSYPTVAEMLAGWALVMGHLRGHPDARVGDTSKILKFLKDGGYDYVSDPPKDKKRRTSDRVD